MDLTNQRRLLNVLTAGFLVVAGGGVVWSLGGLTGADVDPVAVSDQPLERARPDNVDPPTTQSADPADAKLLELPLQKSLYDPPKQPVAATPPKPPAVRPTPIPAPPKQPSLNWTLDGTLIDSDRSVAILTDATGKSDIRRVGEQVELNPPGVLVRKIGPDQVTLELAGKESTLRLQSSLQSGPVSDEDRAIRRRNR